MPTTIEQTKLIDGVTYTTRPLPASIGLVIMPKMIALFGEPVLKLIFSSTGEEREVLMEDPKVIASILHGMASNAADTDGLLVIRDLFQATKADKVRMGDAEVEADIHTHFDIHFSGRYAHLAAVAMWVAQVNFFGP